MKDQKTKQIFFNQKSFEKEVNLHKKYIATLNEFADELATLELEMTPELLDKFLQNNYPAISEAIVNKFLAEAGQNSSYLVDQVKQRAISQTVKFQPYHIKIDRHNIGIGLPPYLIPIKNGRAYLPDELVHQIKDRHCVKIDPDNEQFTKLEVVVNVLNDYQDYCHQNGLDDLINALPESLTTQHYIMAEMIPSDFPIIPDSEYSKLIINPYYFEK